jgi:superfamily I DNA and/or RNA helicase
MQTLFATICSWKIRHHFQKDVDVQVAFGPLAVYDVVRGEEESGGGGSLENREEAHFVIALLNALFAAHPCDARNIAIITPYRAQVLPIGSYLNST